MNALRLAAGLLVFALGAGVQADDKKVDNKTKMLGVWEVVKAEVGQLPAGATFDFAKDGKLKVVVKREDKDMTAEGTYTVDGDKLAFTLKVGDNERKVAVTIKTVNDTELLLVNEDGKTVAFKRKK